MAVEPLTAERIVERAIELLDREGPAAFSMRRLAAELGTSTMSTYHHFADKQALLDAIAESVMAQLARPGPDAAWDDVLRTTSRSFRALTRAHPAVFRVIFAHERPPALTKAAESVVARLVELGFSEQDATVVFRTFIRYLLGVTLVEDGARSSRAELDATFEHGIDLLVAGTAAQRAPRRRAAAAQK